MNNYFMPIHVRRAMHGRGASIAAIAPGANHPDAGMLASFRSVHHLETQKIQLLENGSDEFVIDMKVAHLSTSQAMHLEKMCTVGATTVDGLRARALAYAAWDAGELPYRARVGGTIDDVLLDALVKDLTVGGMGIGHCAASRPRRR